MYYVQEIQAHHTVPARPLTCFTFQEKFHTLIKNVRFMSGPIFILQICLEYLYKRGVLSQLCSKRI
jgi:hypothetical protein